MSNSEHRLGRAFFARPTLAVACDLIGTLLHTRRDDGVTIGRIVEAEAYLGADDLASHAARLKNGRVRSMYGQPGIAYIYRSYGIHAMLNVVTEDDGIAGAVLIRALEPLVGLDLMTQRRGLSDRKLLCSGPGRLCQAMGIQLNQHGTDLATSDDIYLTERHDLPSISVSSRIGISRARDVPWRVFETGNAYVSVHRHGQPIRDCATENEPH